MFNFSWYDFPEWSFQLGMNEYFIVMPILSLISHLILDDACIEVSQSDSNLYFSCHYLKFSILCVCGHLEYLLL